MQLELRNITAEIPLIGFTGALGSGCTYMAEELARQQGYRYKALSDPIHAVAKESGHPQTVEALQDIGNELRRLHGDDHLVRLALQAVDGDWPADRAPKAIILDGIRNVGEIQALRDWPHFYLISVHARRETRQRRLVQAKRILSADAFLRIDARDEEERAPHGQQVKKCNDLADITVINEEDKPALASDARREYVRSKLYEKHLTLIEHIVSRSPIREQGPSRDEALMTAAYCESKRSSCLKRRVGAVIASADGEIISAAHNDVPPGSESCLNHPNYQWCARDKIQEMLAGRLRHCPGCGEKIHLEATCIHCGAGIESFLKRCPSCSQDPEVSYVCPRCHSSVFDEFVLGTGPETGKLLDMCRALHAEESAIINLSKRGIPTPYAATIYTTTFPCNLCANKIVAAGIREVVYAEPYVTRDAMAVLTAKEVCVRPFEGVKSTAYFRLFAQ